MKRLQIICIWLALALSAYAQPTAGGTYQLTLAKINAAIGSGTLAVAKIGGGTPAAGKYVDGGTGNWTTLPTATTDASLLTSGTLPLGRLVGITTTEISATAGIVAGQIASIPNQAASIITSGTMATARLGSGSATASTFLHGDSTWAALVAADIPAHNASASNLTSGQIPLAQLASGTPAAGKYPDGASGVWTTLPSASTLSLSNITSGTLATTLALGTQGISQSGATIFTLTSGGGYYLYTATATAGYIAYWQNDGTWRIGKTQNANIVSTSTASLHFTSAPGGGHYFYDSAATLLGYFQEGGTGRFGPLAGGYAIYSGSDIALGVASTPVLTATGSLITAAQPVAGKEIRFTATGSADTAKSQIVADGNAGNVTAQVPAAKTFTIKDGTIPGLVLGAGTYTVGDVASAGHFYSDSNTARIKNASATQFQCYTTGAYIDRSDALYIRTTGGTNKYKLSDTLIETPALSIGGTIGSSTNPSTGGLALTGKFYISTSQTPASSGATGTTGQICWDASYLYVCVNTNTWTRVAIATW